MKNGDGNALIFKLNIAYSNDTTCKFTTAYPLTGKEADEK
jgi:hypothetical protein